MSILTIRCGNNALPARGESPAAFGRRGIPSGCVAPRSSIPDIFARRALLGPVASFFWGPRCDAGPAPRAARCRASDALVHALVLSLSKDEWYGLWFDKVSASGVSK